MIAWAGALVVPLVLVSWLGLALGQVSVVREQAQHSADLAAIAAAQDFMDPCASAVRIVDANSADALSPRVMLVDCHLDGADVVVDVQAALPEFADRALSWLGVDDLDVRGHAHAGPPD